MRIQIIIPALLLVLMVSSAAQDRTIDQLKAEAERNETGQQAKLYAEIAERLVPIADKQFTDAESVKGHATVQEILQSAAKARDLAISLQNDRKEVEIRLRQTQRHLESVKRTLAAADRPPVTEVEKKIEQYRQDLLESKFETTNDR